MPDIEARRAYHKKYSAEHYLRNKEQYAARRKARTSSYEVRKHDRILQKYGISLVQFNEMRAQQEYKCAICRRHEDEVPNRGARTGVGEPKGLHIDHDHQTNEVRGLLCYNCNSGLGHFKDNYDFVVEASRYLNPRDAYGA